MAWMGDSETTRLALAQSCRRETRGAWQAHHRDACSCTESLGPLKAWMELIIPKDQHIKEDLLYKTINILIGNNPVHTLKER